MTSTHIRTLLAPPSSTDAEAQTLLFLNETYGSWDAYDAASDLDRVVDDAHAHSDALNAQVRPPHTLSWRPL
jgi:hypothetical protein